jgi:hypothetical protein
MSIALSLFAGAGWQFFDNNGVPLAGGLLYTYAAGTTTPQTTYTTSTGSIANSNPIVLDSAGRVSTEIWLTSGVTYKFVLKTSVSVQIGSYDNISGATDMQAALAASSGSSLVGFIQSGAGAVATTVQTKLRQTVSIADFGASPSASASVNSAAIQAAIDSGANNVFVPGGSYNISTTILIANKNGFVLQGAADSSTNFTWTGTAGGTMMTLRGSFLCAINDLWINGNNSAGICLYMPGLNADSVTDTYINSQNEIARCRIGSAVAGSIGVKLGTTTGSQLDNITFYKCFFENSGKHVTVTNQVSLNFTFNDCVFSGYSVTPTTVGVDIISGGLVNFTGCQFLSYASIAHVRRNIGATTVNFANCEMESSSQFFNAPDDSASATYYPVSMVGCTIGYTGTVGTNYVDWQQRAPLSMLGCNFNSTNACTLKFATPGTAGTGGLVFDAGTNYVNTVPQYTLASTRFSAHQNGQFICNAPSNSIIGVGTALTGVVLTERANTTDNIISRINGIGAGGGTAQTTQCAQTTTAITTAKTIAGLEDAALVLVRGSDGAGNEFMDLVITMTAGTPTVITSKTLTGSPAARTYTISSFNLQLAMASGTYTTNVMWFQLTAR